MEDNHSEEERQLTPEEQIAKLKVELEEKDKQMKQMSRLLGEK